MSKIEKPRCETCDLWEPVVGQTGVCHLTTGVGACAGAWYCERHPDFWDWREQERTARRAAAEPTKEEVAAAMAERLAREGEEWSRAYVASRKDVAGIRAEWDREGGD